MLGGGEGQGPGTAGGMEGEAWGRGSHSRRKIAHWGQAPPPRPCLLLPYCPLPQLPPPDTQAATGGRALYGLGSEGPGAHSFRGTAKCWAIAIRRASVPRFSLILQKPSEGGGCPSTHFTDKETES